jgi:hypothetical protein
LAEGKKPEERVSQSDVEQAVDEHTGTLAIPEEVKDARCQAGSLATLYICNTTARKRGGPDTNERDQNGGEPLDEHINT